MASRFGGFKGRGRGKTPGKYHLVDLALSPTNALDERRSMCGRAWGYPLVKDARKADCHWCIKRRG